VVKSLQILSHNHTYQYTQMVNAPAGGRQAQPGVATGQSHLAWRLGYAEVFNDEKSHRPAALRGWFEAAVRGKAKTPRRGEEFSSLCAPPLRWQ
jgi:hypothetical protein